MSDTLYTLVSATTGFEQLEETPIHVNTNAVLVSGHLGTSSNATINGNITVTGTVDGRDIATDGTNLDNTKTTVDDNSANWNTAYTHSQGNVTDHADVSNAGSGQIITATERTNFSNTFTSLKATSADYDNTKTTLDSYSADWNNTKTTVDDNSANWTTGYTHS